MSQSFWVGLLVLALVFSLAVLILRSMGTGVQLRTVAAQPEELAGSFTVILYGGSHPGDPGRVAILDKEGDRYAFAPYAPDFTFTVREGRSPEEALAETEAFIGTHHGFHRKSLRAVLDERNTIIGFELKPLYLPEAFGVDDIIEISYQLRGNAVRVFMRLDPRVEHASGGA